MLASVFLACLVILADAQLSKRSHFLDRVSDCSQLPLYNYHTNIAGPWTLKVDSCYNGTSSRGSCSIEGFGSSSDTTRQPGDKPNRFEHGFVSVQSISLPMDNTEKRDRQI